MKILYVATVSITMGFFPEHFKMLLDAGHTVEIACNCDDPVPEKVSNMGLKTHHIPFSRSPFSKTNLAALKQLKQLVENGDYDIVHTHTPNASACVRLACKNARKRGLKVFYTAHGLHFYKGAPILNWLIYFPVEWFCAHFTDTLITINNEDFELAKKYMHAKNVVYVPGVGIDLNKFSDNDEAVNEKRKELGIPENKTLLISVGELNENKNHETVIKAINGLDVYYIIAGIGDKKEYLTSLIESQNMADKIKLLGYRTDVKDLYLASDVFVFPSFREGLSVSLMEAMACAKPCAVSKIRGNTDLIDENGGGLFSPNDVTECKNAILKAIDNKNESGSYNKEKIKAFSNESVLLKMKELYEK